MRGKLSEFPAFIQYDTMQCGATCLKIISKWYGREFSLEYLEKICSTTIDGVSVFGICEAAKNIGFDVISGKIDINNLINSSFPCILHWNQNHFVVLYKIKIRKGKRLFYISDPGKGRVIYDEKSFRKSFEYSKNENHHFGVCIFLAPTDLFYEKANVKNNTDDSFGYIFKYLFLYRKVFLQLILGILIGSLIQLSLPLLTRSIVDSAISNKDIHFVYLILFAQLALILGNVSIDFIRRWILLHISLRVNILLLSDFFIKLLRLPMSFFDTKLLGDLQQRMLDHSRIEKFLTNDILSVLFAFISFIIFGSILFIYNFNVFCFFLFGSIIYGIWISIFFKKRRKLDFAYFGLQSINNSRTYQFLEYAQEIKLNSCEQRRRWEWEEIQVELYHINIQKNKLQQTQEAGGVFINEFKNILITVVSATQVINGSMSLGMMLSVQYMIGQLNSPIEHLISFFYSLQDVKISVDRVNQIHVHEEEQNISQGDISFKNYNINLCNVDFKYDIHNETKVLENVSLEIPEGKITAIVGASGSGKTTLIKLLLGYYSILNGEIIIGGNSLDKYNLKLWRKQCGVVLQDSAIFSESIARNIAVDDNEIDYEKLNNAIKLANIDEFIENLPLKHSTEIGKNGIGISQGQKQRILIARAIYKNPKFLFFDEATNSLDANNERIIVNNLNRIYRGKTVVIVAHRLSTVQNADQIIVLDKGRVLEIGTHSELLLKKGEYYKLVKNQLELGE